MTGESEVDAIAIEEGFPPTPDFFLVPALHAGKDGVVKRTAGPAARVVVQDRFQPSGLLLPAVFQMCPQKGPLDETPAADEYPRPANVT